MKHRRNLLISLEKRHADNILAATKQVELRRRRMHVERGDIVWLYVKKPIGAVIGYATVKDCLLSTPAQIWKKFGKVSGLDRSEFNDYFDDREFAFSLILTLPKELKIALSLEEIRSTAQEFHPPQFYCRLPIDSPVLDLLKRRKS